jgi:hypothetical protein
MREAKSTNLWNTVTAEVLPAWTTGMILWDLFWKVNLWDPLKGITGILGYATGLIPLIKNANKVLDGFNKWFIGPGALGPWEQAMNDIVEGKVGGPKVPRAGEPAKRPPHRTWRPPGPGMPWHP